MVCTERVLRGWLGGGGGGRLRLLFCTVLKSVVKCGDASFNQNKSMDLQIPLSGWGNVLVYRGYSAVRKRTAPRVVLCSWD